MSEWISVKDRLPDFESRTKILVSDRKNFVIAYPSWLYRNPEGILRCPFQGWRGLEVKWWMPLPELPEEEQE